MPYEQKNPDNGETFISDETHNVSEEKKQKNIRAGFYLVFIVILLFQFLTFSIHYLSSLRRDYDQLSQRYFESTMDHKRNQIRIIVNEKIQEIEVFENLLISQFRDSAGNTGRMMARILEREGLDYFGSVSSEWFPSSEWSYRIHDTVTDKIISVETDTGAGDSFAFLDAKLSGVRMTAAGRYNIDVSVSTRKLNETFIEGVHALVYATRLPRDGYVWVNWILDYDGGEGYAVRLIHPNLPGTEGDLLSTATKDIKGNLPYLNELNGVKTDGEVLHEYYFKKLNSEQIIRKLSYGKLIPKFNWIIATGLNLDDVDARFEEEKLNLEQIYGKRLSLFSITIAFSLLISLLLIILFERRVSVIIRNYIDENKEEKMKLAEAYEQMKHMAYVDNLTNLLNRRAMLENLEKEISRYKRGNPGFCIILSDIDKFKIINDTYGHNTGDFILRETADILKRSIRLEDQISRWGGEEFLFFIPDCTRNDGLLIAEKLRKTMDEHLFQENGITHHVTMTFGVTSSREDLDLKSLIHEADQNLYKGKRSTRNCVVG